MTGAESLLQTLVQGGVNTCFMNPGTSEMHFVLALDSVPQMHPVLCLFEGVATASADGYARMTGNPAATLLHLGPGLGNGIANLHNARKAHSALVNLVGQHATQHLKYDAPLTSDIEGIAAPVSHWVRTSANAESVAADVAEAIGIARTPPGQIATLILPADATWEDANRPAQVPKPTSPINVPEDRIKEIAELLRREEETVILVGNHVMGNDHLVRLLNRIEQGTSARIIGNKFVSRVSRGAGRPVIPQLPYAVDESVKLLGTVRHVVLLGTKEPVGFFAYPGKPSLLCPADATIQNLASLDEDLTQALEDLVEQLGLKELEPVVADLIRPTIPSGPLTADFIWTALTALMPENAIVCEEAITGSTHAGLLTRHAPPHDWLHVSGGSIGQALPLAVGAAVACPDRQVFAMEADGSGMYVLQSLWTQARESLKVVNVIFSNRSYQILRDDIPNIRGNEPGPIASAMMSLDNPPLDWVSLAKGMGVTACRVTTAEEFATALKKGIEGPGPCLIEAVL